MLPGRIIAASLGLVGFAVAIIAGMAADNTALTTLQRALLAMGGCYVAGRILGMLGHRAVIEHVAEYKAAHPIERLKSKETDASIPADASDAPEPSAPPTRGATEPSPQPAEPNEPVAPQQAA